jgi:hypothetical protein
MKCTLIILLALLGTVRPNCANAQDAPDVQWYVVWEDPVMPSRLQQYETAAGIQNGLFRKYGFPRTNILHSTDDYIYYWSIPIKDISEMVRIDHEWNSFMSKLKENKEVDLNEIWRGCYEYSLPRIIYYSGELSYVPDAPRLDPAEARYVRMWFCYVLPGHDDQFRSKLLRYIGEFKKSRVNSGFETYVGMMGTEMPMYIWIERYRDEIDMWTTRQRIFSEMGGDVLDIWGEMQQDIRKMEIKTGRYRPDLSYKPTL